MPSRSKVFDLPKDVRKSLDARLIEGGFRNYRDLADWLAKNGFTIGKSSLQRYGANLEERLDALQMATEQAEALVKASPDDAGALADAALRMIQEQIFSALLAAGEGDLKKLAAVARAIAETARAGTMIRAERRRALEAAAAAATGVAEKAGLSPATVAKLRAAIEGAPA